MGVIENQERQTRLLRRLAELVKYRTIGRIDPEQLDPALSWDSHKLEARLRLKTGGTSELAYDLNTLLEARLIRRSEMIHTEISLTPEGIAKLGEIEREDHDKRIGRRVTRYFIPRLDQLLWGGFAAVVGFYLGREFPKDETPTPSPQPQQLTVAPDANAAMPTSQP